MLVVYTAGCTLVFRSTCFAPGMLLYWMCDSCLHVVIMWFSVCQVHSLLNMTISLFVNVHPSSLLNYVILYVCTYVRCTARTVCTVCGFCQQHTLFSLHTCVWNRNCREKKKQRYESEKVVRKSRLIIGYVVECWCVHQYSIGQTKCSETVITFVRIMFYIQSYGMILGVSCKSLFLESCSIVTQDLQMEYISLMAQLTS